MSQAAEANREAAESRQDVVVDQLIDVGSDIAGNLAATTIGFFAAGPPGALAGGVSGPILGRSVRAVAHELKNRLLGPREEIRLGATIAFAAETLRKNLAEGKTLRADGFFAERRQVGRSAAEEVIEATLTIAQRDYEELKLRHYGSLLANISCNSDIDHYHASILIKELRDLSYRQLCLLALAEGEGFSQPGYSPELQDPNQTALQLEVDDLYARRLVAGEHDSTLGMTIMTATPRGSLVVHAAELGRIPKDQLQNLDAHLTSCAKEDTAYYRAKAGV